MGECECHKRYLIYDQALKRNVWASVVMCACVESREHLIAIHRKSHWMWVRCVWKSAKKTPGAFLRVSYFTWPCPLPICPCLMHIRHSQNFRRWFAFSSTSPLVGLGMVTFQWEDCGSPAATPIQLEIHNFYIDHFLFYSLRNGKYWKVEKKRKIAIISQLNQFPEGQICDVHEFSQM